MDIPSTDISMGGIGAALIVGALGFLATQGYGWLAKVDDAVDLVEQHDSQIGTVSEDVKEIKQIVTGVAVKVSKIDGKVEIVEKVVIENKRLGDRLRDSLEDE